MNKTAGGVRLFQCSMAAGVLLLSGRGAVVAQNSERVADDSGDQLRQFIGEQVGGIERLQVPAKNVDIPVPRQPDGTVNYRFQTTEAKRFLGKLLFHDPIRTARININQAQPVDLPAGTAFGGTVNASDPHVQEIVNAT